MNKPELIVLSGLPGSGKSTYAKAWLSEDPDARVRINYDEMRLARFGPNWTFNRKQEDEVKLAAIRTASESIAAGLSVVIDNTNLPRRVRAEWETLGAHLGATVIEEEIDTPIDVCIARDRARLNREGGRVGRAVIEMMALRYGFIDWNDYDGQFVIVDIDGTVADCSHRLHHINPAPHDDQCNKIHCTCLLRGYKPKKNWPAFQATVDQDKPIMPVINLIRRLGECCYPNSRGCSCDPKPIAHTIFVTGRDTSIGIQTEDWLYKHGLYPTMLLMRNSGDHRPDVEVKKDILDLLPKERIAYVIEDRDRCVQLYRENGLTVLQPANGAY